MKLKFEVWNYRAFQHASWGPQGVCALVGPNGAGKTTLLRVPEFFRQAYQDGLTRAMKFTGGFWGLRHLAAERGADCHLRVSVGELSWDYVVGWVDGIVDVRAGEQVMRGDETVVERNLFSNVVEFGGEKRNYGDGSALRVAVGGSESTAAIVDPLVKFIRGTRLFRDYDLNRLRGQGSPADDERAMSSTGDNAFSVLRNWRDRRGDRHRYEFVLGALRRAFPNVCDDLEFDVVAQTVSVRLITKSLSESVPVQVAPDGWLVGLLHLTAVASTSAETMISFDEFENSLHPFAIRVLIQHFREWSAEHDIVICLATHSPVVIDEFNDEDERERLFVLEPGRETQPVRVTDLADREWLRQFTLGRLFSHGDIGSPTAAQQNEQGQALPV
jgi:predicted ATPase